MFYREIDTKTVLSHLVFIGLFPKSAEFTESGGGAALQRIRIPGRNFIQKSCLGPV